MKKPDFLNKLKKEGKLELVDESEEISDAYNIKSENCLKSAKILFNAKLYENSTTEAYYAMYNSVLSLLFRCGIKSENHTASIILLKKLFGLDNLKTILKKAKKERIDKQYYVTDEKSAEITQKDTEEIIETAENFTLEIRSYIKNTGYSKIQETRNAFQEI